MPSIRSIEKEAYRWADLGVDTMEEAAVYMQSQLQLQANVGKIQSLLGIEGRKLTAGEEKLPAYCSETLKWYEESWDGDPQAPFIAAVEEYYTQIYRLFTENRPHDIRIEQVRQQLAVIEEAHRQNPQIH